MCDEIWILVIPCPRRLERSSNHLKRSEGFEWAMRGVLGLALLALVAASVQAGPSDALTIPAPAVGDAGVYTLVSLAPEDVAHPLPRGVELTRFAWLPDASTQDAQGREVLVNELYEETAGAASERAVRHYGAQDGRLVAVTRFLEATHDGGLVRRTRDYEHADAGPRTTDLDQGFCGAREPLLQGRAVPLDRPGPLFSGNCRLGTGAFESGLAGTDFAFEERLDVEGVPVFVFRQVEDERVRVWLSPDVPYPLLIAYPQRDGTGEPNGDALQVVRLVGFARGGTPLGSGGAAEGPGVEVGLAAWTPWGPDDRLAQHPFPLSRAFALARDDPDDATLRDFLNASDAPFVHKASYAETLSSGWTVREWSFTVAGDGRALDASVMERWSDDPGGPSGPLDPLGARDPLRPASGATVVHESRFGAAAPFQLGYADVPHELPALPDALRAWRAFRDDALGDAAPNAWSFSYQPTCDDAGACRFGALRFEVGLARVEDSTQQRSILTLDHDARVVAFDDLVPGRGPASPVPPPFAVGTAAVALQSPLEQWPVGTLWVAGGLLALAAGAVAWLAWTGRLGVVGLFSRIERTNATDHALRARILAQVTKEPGLDVTTLGARNGVGWSTVMHHVRKLERLDAVRTANVGGRRCVFPTGARLTPATLSLPLLRREAPRRVLLAISEAPGTLQRDVARRLGLDEATVSHHARRLEAAGLLETRVRGREHALFLTPVARELLTASEAP